MALQADDKLVITKMITEQMKPLSDSINELTKAVTTLVAQQQKPATNFMPSMGEIFQFHMMKSLMPG